MKRSKQPPAKRELRKILSKLKAVHTQIERWLKVHGKGCSCKLCSVRFDKKVTHGELHEEDLRGVSWAIAQAVAIVGSEL
jgi:hypothetical protein